MKKSNEKTSLNRQNAKMIGRRVDFSMKGGDERDRIITDPQGSYTGVPEDPYDKPVQDADDL